MKEVKSLRILWGGIAIAIYAGLIALLLFYFNSRHASKPKHFVKKNEKRIQLASSKHVEAIKVKTVVEERKSPIKKSSSQKTIVKKHSIKKPVVKKIPAKPKVKKIHKEKIVKKIKHKKRDENRSKVKKHTPIKINKPRVKKPKKSDTDKLKKVPKKTSDLFATVHAKAKENESLKQNKSNDKPKSASQKISESIKNQKESQSGVENAYYAKVQSLLETWPAQSDYAGEKAMVHLYVKPTGLFEFKVKSQSGNIEFNLGLIDFLMQLQKLGFGTHKGGKTYEFEVEFIAKE